MIKLVDILKEAFDAGIDNDLPFAGKNISNNNDNRYITSDKNSNYKLTNTYTHGGLSHALKHADEFTSTGKVSNMLRRVWNSVSKNINKPLYYKQHDNSNFIKNFNPEEINDTVLANTIDYINDKEKDGLRLEDFEEKLLGIAKKLENLYLNQVKGSIRGYVPLENDISKEDFLDIIRNEKPFGFPAKYSEERGGEMGYYILKPSIGDNKVIISVVSDSGKSLNNAMNGNEDGIYLRTAFKFIKPNNVKDFIDKVIKNDKTGVDSSVGVISKLKRGVDWNNI